MKYANKNILFIGGKGGVGKSTSAAALALSLSEDHLKTLVVSTDPAHNLGDIFRLTIGGEKTKISDELYALEINPETETEKYISSVKENIKETVQSSMMDEVHRQLDTAKASPGAEEAALFDKLINIILEEKKNFDRLVFDTAPTGHTIRLLSLPELLGVWIDGLLEKRQKTNENYTQLLNDGEPVEDPIYDVLLQRRERFAQAREIMLDPQYTGFIFVVNPERLSILETEKAMTLLDEYHLHVRTLIVNKKLPDTVDGEFYSQRKKHEKTYLHMLDDTFTKQQQIHVPLFSRDIANMEDLETFSEYLRE